MLDECVFCDCKFTEKKNYKITVLIEVELCQTEAYFIECHKCNSQYYVKRNSNDIYVKWSV